MRSNMLEYPISNLTRRTFWGCMVLIILLGCVPLQSRLLKDTSNPCNLHSQSKLYKAICGSHGSEKKRCMLVSSVCDQNTLSNIVLNTGIPNSIRVAACAKVDSVHSETIRKLILLSPDYVFETAAFQHFDTRDTTNQAFFASLITDSSFCKRADLSILEKILESIDGNKYGKEIMSFMISFNTSESEIYSFAANAIHDSTLFRSIAISAINSYSREAAIKHLNVDRDSSVFSFLATKGNGGIDFHNLLIREDAIGKLNNSSLLCSLAVAETDLSLAKAAIKRIITLYGANSNESINILYQIAVSKNDSIRSSSNDIRCFISQYISDQNVLRNIVYHGGLNAASCAVYEIKDKEILKAISLDMEMNREIRLCTFDGLFGWYKTDFKNIACYYKESNLNDEADFLLIQYFTNILQEHLSQELRGGGDGLFEHPEVTMYSFLPPCYSNEWDNRIANFSIWAELAEHISRTYNNIDVEMVKAYQDFLYGLFSYSRRMYALKYPNGNNTIEQIIKTGLDSFEGWEKYIQKKRSLR